MLSSQDQSAYLRALGVPGLLDAVVASLLANPPSTPQGAVAAIHRAIDENAAILTAEASRCFSQGIRDLHDGVGFTASSPLFFCGFTPNGELVELFPHGSRIRVTPFNVDHFMHCSEARQNGQRLVPFLPLAVTQSLGGSYAPVLDVIADINAGHPQLAMSEAEWNAHRVTYCVPNNGVVVDLLQNGSNTPVAFADIRSFVSLARQKLQDLQRVGRRASVGGGSAPAVDPRLPLAPQPTQPAATASTQKRLSPNQPSQQQQQQHSSSDTVRPPPLQHPPTPVITAPDAGPYSQQQQQQQRGGGGSGGSEPGSASNKPWYEMLPLVLDELGRANTPNGDPLSKEEFELLDVYYCVPIAGKIVPLVPGGHKIRVKFEDKDHYVRLAKEKLGLLAPDASTASPVHSGQRMNLRTTAKDAHQGAGDGLLSPAKYEFDLFRKTGVATPVTPGQVESPVPASGGQRPLSAAEVDYHFRTLLRQLSATKWSAAEMENLNLYFIAPLDGKFIDLIPNGAATPVTAERKDEFVLLARAFLEQHAPATSTIQLESNMLPRKDDETAVESMFSPTHFQQDLFAPYTTTIDLEAGASSAAPPPVKQSEPENAEAAGDEARFWEMINLLESGNGPDNVEDLNLRFVLKFPNDRLLPLKDNGAAKKVSNANLTEFIELVRGKRDLIHLAFKFSHQKTVEDDKNFSRYAPSDAPTWNKYDLSAADLSNPVFELVEGLKQGQNFFTDTEFVQMKLTFCIPLISGKKFDLIPNGHNTPVTMANRMDYISRVEYEKRRLQKRLRQQGSDDQSVAARASALGGSLRNSSNPSPAASASTMHQQQHSSSNANGSLTKRNSMLMRASITTMPLTAKQIYDLHQYEVYLQLFTETDFTDSEWSDMQLVYAIHVGDLTIELQPGGARAVVPKSKKDEYVKLARAKIREMLNDTATRERAVAELPPQGEPQVALFSPTHFEKDFFAPAQEMTMRK